MSACASSAIVPARFVSVILEDYRAAFTDLVCGCEQVGGSMHGSEARNKEKARLRRGVTVLVCTPGRLLDHLQHTEAFRTADLRWVVLDDVDQILQTDAKDQLGE